MATWNDGKGEYAPGKHNPDDSHVDAYKFTLAQQFSPMTTFWARPSIRFYVYYLGGKLMNSQYTNFSVEKNGKWNGHDGEVSIGAQAEASLSQWSSSRLPEKWICQWGSGLSKDLL